jgi:hypothetical protein
LRWLLVKHNHALDELQLTDDRIIIHIPRYRRFVCTQRGSQKVTIQSIWPERNPSGAFYCPAMFYNK